jgi:hypothetical protein
MIGVILSGRFIESNLQVEFGDILPVELPLYNKPLLSHQVDFLKKYCSEIYLTIPHGYKSDKIGDVKIIETNSECSVFDALKSIVERFRDNKKIMIHYGDSLFLNCGVLDLDKNYIFVQEPTFTFEWGISNQKGFVPAGCFLLETEIFLEKISQSINFNELVVKLSEDKLVEAYDSFEWLDFGHTLTYYNSKKYFLETRFFNTLETNGGFIVKSSKDVFKMWVEFNWLRAFKKDYPTNIPFVEDFKIKGDVASYSLEYINNPVLSDIFVFGKLGKHAQIRILEAINKLLKKIRSVKTENHFEANFMKEKLLLRRDQIIEVFKKNGKDSLVANKFIDDNITFYSKTNISQQVLMHGDLCFSNILFNFSTFEPILIDPRGYTNREEGFSMYGPLNYDLYKLAHSYVAGYDFVISGFYEHSYFDISGMRDRLDIFCQIFKCDHTEIKMGMQNLFISMLPLHSDSIQRQANFIRILQLIDQI